MAPAGSPLNISLWQDIVLQLCFHPLPPLVLSSCCFEPRHQTVIRHFIGRSNTPQEAVSPCWAVRPVGTVLRIARTSSGFWGWQLHPGRSTWGARVRQKGVPHFTSRVRGFATLAQSRKMIITWPWEGEAGATAGQLPICQLLANWSDALQNPKSLLRDHLISGRVYTWFLRFPELIEFSLEYFLPSPSAPVTASNPKFTGEWLG